MTRKKRKTIAQIGPLQSYPTDLDKFQARICNDLRRPSATRLHPPTLFKNPPAIASRDRPRRQQQRLPCEKASNNPSPVLMPPIPFISTTLAPLLPPLAPPTSAQNSNLTPPRPATQLALLKRAEIQRHTTAPSGAIPPRPANKLPGLGEVLLAQELPPRILHYIAAAAAAAGRGRSRRG